MRAVNAAASCHVISCDVSRHPDVVDMSVVVTDILSGQAPDVIINNAGVGSWDSTEESTAGRVQINTDPRH